MRARPALLAVLVLLLASCFPPFTGDARVSVSRIEGGYRAATEVRGELYLSTNTGQTITAWKPIEACRYDPRYSDKRTIICAAPGTFEIQTGGVLGWQLVERR